MRCPRCHVNLHNDKMDSITIGECLQCGGIWSDHGELDQIIESTDPDLRWLDVDFWKANSDFSAPPDSMGCPKCGRYYLTRLADQATHTAVALCNNCRGIWGDADQMHAILQAIIRHADSMDSSDYVKESLRQVADMIQTASQKPFSVSIYRDLAAVLRELNLDVAALQEVAFAVEPHHNNILACLARSMDAIAIAGPTLPEKKGHYGNAILSRIPPKRVDRLDMSVPGREPRGAIAVSLRFNGSSIKIMATHLGLRPSSCGTPISDLLSVFDSRQAPSRNDHFTRRFQ